MKKLHFEKFKAFVLNKRHEITVYLICFFVMLIGYCFYLNLHFATDTYTDIINTDDILRGTLQNGRISSYILIRAFRLFGFNHVFPAIHQFFVSFINIILFSLLPYIIYRLIIKTNENMTLFPKIILLLAGLCMFCNPFFCDWWQFAELAIAFPLSILFSILAANYITNIDKKPLFRYAFSLLSAIVAMCFYQVGMIYYVIFAIILFMNNYLNNKYKKHIVLEIIKIISIYIFSLAANLLYFKIFLPGNSRTQLAKIDFLGNIKAVLKLHNSLYINNSNLMPNYVFLIVLVICILFLIFVFIKQPKHKVKLGLLLLFSTIMMYLSVFLSFIMASPNEFWASPRALVPFMGIPSFFAILAVVLSNHLKAKKREKPNKSGFHPFILSGFGITTAALSLLLIICVVQIIKVSSGLNYTNKRDLEEAKMIAAEIQKYESRTGVKIQNISFCNDKAITSYYPNVIGSYDINYRAFYRGWARVPLMNYAANRQFKPVNMDKVVENMFKGKNWDSFSADQIIFKNDSVYIAIY